MNESTYQSSTLDLACEPLEHRLELGIFDWFYKHVVKPVADMFVPKTPKIPFPCWCGAVIHCGGL
jgi:hypothetical protein